MEELNAIDGKYLKTLKPTELVPGRFYDCKIIKRVETRDYGVNYLIRSKDFQMFLPKRFSGMDIDEDVAGRKFRITGFMQNTRFPSKRSPLLEFIVVDQVQQKTLEVSSERYSPQRKGQPAVKVTDLDAAAANECAASRTDIGRDGFTQNANLSDSENSTTSSSLSREMEIIEELSEPSTDGEQRRDMIPTK